MKILYLMRDITDCGGIQQTTCHEINSIIEKNMEYDISIVSLYHKNYQTFFKLDSKVKKYALFDKVIDTKNNYFKIKKILSKTFEKLDPYLIVVQGTAFANYIPKKIWNESKVIVCEHGHYYMGRKFGLHWTGVKKSIKYANAIVTLTELDAQTYRKYVKRNIVETIYNPCVFPRYYLSKYNRNSKIIVSCGTLDKVKRFDHVIMAAEKIFTKHSDWKWYIYGDGPLRTDLQRMIKEKKLETNVYLKGYEKDKNKVYGNKSFMVLTSSFEGFGMVLIEAMQYRLPIVSYDIKYGPKEIVENDVNGYLIEDGNIELLSKTVESFIVNTEQRQIMSQNAYQSLDRFDNERITNKWIELFESFR